MSAAQLHTNLSIENGLQHSAVDEEQRVFKRQKQHNISSNGLAFFTEGKINLLEERLGNKRVTEVLGKLEAISASRRNVSLENLFTAPLCNVDEFLSQQCPAERRALYIRTFFEDVHSIWPYLPRDAFEDAATAPNLGSRLESDYAWAATFYAVLSLGVLHEQGGSFAPLQGPAWLIFQRAMKLFPFLLIARKTVAVAQALTTMALFALNYSSWSLEELLVTEAARICVALHMNKISQPDEDADVYSRVFWTVYCLEKEYCFQSSSSTLTLEQTSSLDFGTLIAFCQLQSRAYKRLFSVSALSNPREVICVQIDSLRNDLEAWKLSTPLGCRPGLPLPIARLDIYLNCNTDVVRAAQSKTTLMEAARSIVEVVQLLPMEPSTPMNMLALAPVIATFILFELIVFNPYHPGTPRNQAFLQIMAGYWVRLEVVSDGQVDGQLLAEFARISQEFLSKARPPEDHIVQQLRSPAASTTEQIVLSEDLTLHGERSAGGEIGVQPAILQTANDVAGGDNFPLDFPLPDDWFENGMFGGELRFVDLFSKGLE
ncbi:Transcription factor [Penicillium occitanis (nom. inval.)]|nr:Transcription factor [Penicillium occitanis (nom. inval.)]PCG89129.1 hypothetical protein PENOC_107910 [Penicillium occitanis (nom. inval.)]